MDSFWDYMAYKLCKIYKSYKFCKVYKIYNRRQPAWEWQVDVVDYAIKKVSQGRRSFVCH